MFFSAVKLGILTWGVYGIDSFAASRRIAVLVTSLLASRESGRLPLGVDP